MAKLKESTVEVKGKKKKAIDVGSGTKLTCAYDVDLVEMLAKARYEKLVYGKTDHNDNFLASWVDQEFDNLKKGLKNPDIAIRSQKQFAEIIRETQGFFDSKKVVDTDFAEYTIRKALFPWQKEVFDDANLRKLLICSRRTGKTYFEAAYMIAHCMKPFDQIEVNGRIIEKKRSAIYVGMTIEKAAANIWQTLQDLAKACHFPNIKFDNADHVADHAMIM